MEWKSVHIFIHDFRSLDDYIKSEFCNLIARLEVKFEKFFYIRYWLGGPHIRLRFKLKDEGDYDMVLHHIKSNLKMYLKDKEVELVNKGSYYKKEMLELENIKEVGWYDHGSVQEIAYEPEYDRYGGRDKIQIAEGIFHNSSLFTLSVNKRFNFGQKIMVAFDLMVLSFYLFPSTLGGYEYYYKMWEKLSSDRFPFMDQLDMFSKRYNDIMSKPDEYLGKYDMYFKGFRDGIDLCRSDDVRRNLSILLSHMHMTNNRLGIMPEIEYELAKVIYKLKEVDYVR